MAPGSPAPGPLRVIIYIVRVDVRRPLFGDHGRIVVAFFCTWELIALPSWSPVPTISETVERHPWFGILLLALLGHHWFVELEQTISETIDAIEDALADALEGAAVA